jgi:CP family cyanate transporter-like MFS transporter
VWLVGVSLRLTLLAIPPVIPLIHRDLPLNETGIAALSGLPVLLFAAAAVPGSLMIARLGAHRVLVVGLVLTAVASGLRGAGPSIAVLFGMTFLMGIGMAVSHPAIPSLINVWLPDRVGIATAVYVNGLLVGEMLSASLTLPLVLPLTGGRWAVGLAVWAVPVLLAGLLLAGMIGRLPDASGSRAARWWPDWHLAETWQLGVLMAGASVGYLTANAFIPDFLRVGGQPALIGPCLTALNAGQVPASIVLALTASTTVGRRAPLVAAGAGTLVSLGLFLAGPPWAQVLGAGMLGFFGAGIFVMALALPPMLAARGDVHRLSAGMFAINYAYSFVAPLVGGAAWDLTGVPAISFLPVVVSVATALLGIAVIPRARLTK